MDILELADDSRLVAVTSPPAATVGSPALSGFQSSRSIATTRTIESWGRKARGKRALQAPLPTLRTAAACRAVLISSVRNRDVVRRVRAMGKVGLRLAIGLPLLVAAMKAGLGIGFWGGLGVLTAGVGLVSHCFSRSQDVDEPDFELIWDAPRRMLEVVRFGYGEEEERRILPLHKVDSIVLRYPYCASCGQLFGRQPRFQSDPIVELRLHGGSVVPCGEHDLEPAQKLIERLGYHGLLDEIRLEKRYEVGGLCPSCAG